MDINSIGTKYNELNSELKRTLSTMTYTDRVVTIRSQIKELQNLCPHNNGTYDFSKGLNCPYCGKQFGE